MKFEWNQRGHYTVVRPGAENPPRQGCRWNEAEYLDLIDAVRRGESFAGIARRHERSVGAITVQFKRLCKIVLPRRKRRDSGQFPDNSAV